MPYQPTTAELRAEYRRSRLWVIGWSFTRAMQTPLIHGCLTRAIDSRRRQAARHGQPLPTQPSLL